VLVRNGRIVDVEQKCQGPIDIDLEDSILMPGLINSHTHLEFSGLDEPLSADGGFTEWVRQVIAYRQNRWGSLGSDEQKAVRLNDLHRGLEESNCRGVVAIADIATSPYPMAELLSVESQRPALIWGLGEVLGWTQQRQLEMRGAFVQMQADAMAAASGQAAGIDESSDGSECRASNGGFDYRWGISPHAPYSTSPRLIQWCIERSRIERRLLAMHLGETREEMEWLRERKGMFAELLERMGIGRVPFLPRWKSARDYLLHLSRAWRVLIVHGNYLGGDDWEVLVKNRGHMSVVYCPRTHRHFGHATYPLKEMLAAGVRVTVGTDSRASNPDLSVWGELQEIAGGGSGLSPADILKLGTLDAAQGLGIEGNFGTIEAGKSTRLSVAKIVGTAIGNASTNRFWELLWDSEEVDLPVGFGL
jgi:cytosine/adenosine deaminase-related metal-dependent hydrolase